MAVLVAAYVVGLIVDSDGFSPLVDGWLGVASVCASAVVCCVAVFRARSRRLEVLLAAAAVTSYALGNTYYYVTVGVQGSILFPNWADAGYLGCYVLMLSALVVSARRHLRGWAAAVWLDGAVGSLGAASVMAALLSPVLTSVASAPLSWATVVAVAYPAMNIALVAAVAGIAALLGWGGSQRWSLLLAGLSVHATVNLIYALQLLEEEYVIGTLLDAGWPIGLALMAVWVDNAARRNLSSTHSPDGVRALAVPALATGAGLSLLLLASQAQLSMLAVGLAGVTMVVAAARTQHAFRLLVRLAELRRQATTDDLTGLPNRRAMYTGMTAQLVAGADEHQALLLLDLDSFKEVNDSLGHHVGDRLLIKVGACLSEHLRDGDMLSRLGGDEFAVLLAGTDQRQAEAVAVKLRTALAEPLAVDDIAIQTDASVGIALFPEHGSEVSTLLRRADIAMYKAKNARTGHHVYEFSDDGHGPSDREELRVALDSAELVLHYQPKVDLGTGDVHGVEALIRWDHPTRGLIYPDKFLGLVQDAGLMPKMTQLVLEMALDQAATWRGQGQHLSVAVNLSAASLIDPGLPKLISQLLEIRSVPPSALQVEITEESLLGDRVRVRSVLDQLRATGIRIAVDDFGTGYSSLAYLRDLPLDELKLDRSFIAPMADDARAAALVVSTIALAHSLGLRMVAEGVEHEVTYTELARNGCDEAQGFYISRAVPAAELDHWLARRRRATELI
jgi:diguanylate cyclase (GGDEF)-like protein